MYLHNVIFKLAGPADERRALAERFAAAINALKSQIDVIVDIHAGVNVNPAEQADVMLTVTLNTFDDIAAYATHPAHLAAAALLKGHVDTRLCVDTELVAAE